MPLAACRRWPLLSGRNHWSGSLRFTEYNYLTRNSKNVNISTKSELRGTNPFTLYPSRIEYDVRLTLETVILQVSDRCSFTLQTMFLQLYVVLLESQNDDAASEDCQTPFFEIVNGIQVCVSDCGERFVNNGECVNTCSTRRFMEINTEKSSYRKCVDEDTCGHSI